MKLGLSKWLFALVLGAMACGPAKFTYAPVATTSAEIAGMAAAVYPVRSPNGPGEVHIAVLDVMDARYKPHARMTRRALRVSVFVSNRSTTTWRLESNEQRIELSGRRTRVSIDAEPDKSGKHRVVDIPPSSTRWVDLTFLVPDDADDTMLEKFELTWSVRLGPEARLSRLTSFEKLLAPPAHVGVERPADAYSPTEPPGSPGMPLPGGTPPFRRGPEQP